MKKETENIEKRIQMLEEYMKHTNDPIEIIIINKEIIELKKILEDYNQVINPINGELTER